jgi:hypothetical protein
MATAYTPKAALRPRAGGATLLAAGLAGAAGGVAAHVVARAIYLAFLVPVAWGLAVGFTVAAAARALRVSRPGIAATAAEAGVVVAAAVQVGLDYRLDRHERALAAARIYEMSSIGSGPDEFIEDSYRARLAELDLRSYLARRYGMDPELDPAGGLASSIGPRGALAVGGLELLIGAAIASVLARRQALEPACSACGAWRVESRLGVVAHGVAEGIAERLRRGDAAGAAALLAPPDTRELVALSRLSCPVGHDGGGGVLRIEARELDARRRERVHICAELEVAAEELGAITSSLEEFDHERG